MIRKGRVRVGETEAGFIEENEDGYVFSYSSTYLNSTGAKPVSLTLPLREEPFISKTMFPFFDGLIPEGWLLDIAQKTWKLDPRDRMGLLLSCCKDCIGAVSIHPVEEPNA
jgi:serine/threonine-protein kinase HipA